MCVKCNHNPKKNRRRILSIQSNPQKERMEQQQQKPINSKKIKDALKGGKGKKGKRKEIIVFRNRKPQRRWYKRR